MIMPRRAQRGNSVDASGGRAVRIFQFRGENNSIAVPARHADTSCWREQEMTTIGILGTGRVALRLATLFADRGHNVTLGSRTPDRARALARAMDRPGITGGSYADSATRS